MGRVEDQSSRKVKSASGRDVYIGKQRLRNPKKYINNYYDSEEYAA